ncbi:MAG: hypothetical protein ABW148_11465 [Sedimenticola sp.]
MESDNQQLTLRISVKEMTDFCRTITNNSSNTARKHAALIAMEGFISQHSGTGKYTTIYHQLLDIIDVFSEKTRSDLLQEYTDELLPALHRESSHEIARLHRQLSRNGFHDILGRASKKLTDSEYHQLSCWLESWCYDAEQRGREASGYPDAINLAAAGIDVGEYQAMNDLRKLLER